MALKSTIFKANLQIADLDRNYYQNHALTVARHPSETDERMMVRVLAFALYADSALAFGKGLSAEDEPDLWRKDLTGAIELYLAGAEQPPTLPPDLFPDYVQQQYVACDNAESFRFFREQAAGVEALSSSLGFRTPARSPCPW